MTRVLGERCVNISPSPGDSGEPLLFKRLSVSSNNTVVKMS